MLPPLTFEPLLKRIRWGGRRLGTLLGKAIGPETDYAESWEIADHADGQSRIANGPFGGMTLSELMQTHGPDLLGRQAGLTQFPLLIKYLDANDWLSLQVHPDDRLAGKYSPSEKGKTEAWVIIDAQPDSRICAGLNEGVTEVELRESLQTGTTEELLHFVSVAAGDCLFIPAGTVHAIGPGIVLAEVQQQSNLTFRLHDWGRVDSTGSLRAIHVAESLACTNFARGPVSSVQPLIMRDSSHSFEELVRCDYFVIRRHQSAESFRMADDDRFRILMTLDGEGRIETTAGIETFSKGSTVLVPACSHNIRIVSGRRLSLLEIYQP